MTKFLVGIVVGITISTVGVSGIARMVEKGVDTTKSIVQETAK
jgi:hypothetical protein